MKRYAPDQTGAGMFPKSAGAWVKFSDVSETLSLARKIIVAERAVLIHSHVDATGQVTDELALSILKQYDEALAAIGSLK